MIDVRQSPVAEVLDILLEDKTTKRGIIWATDSYQAMGEGFHDKNSITKECLLLHGEIIQPRIEKDARIQADRTRRKAEVFTPAWLCNRMNNEADVLWFERRYVFNRETEDGMWSATTEKILFSAEDDWKRYVDSRKLEITCGEAPFLVSPYDTSTGHLIEPLERRMGILDRKLRVVNENTTDESEWVEWALRGVEACYGYEYQGDNLLIARINVLTTFADYFRARWRREPELKLLRKVANRIAWNLWQMDGLKDTVPLGKPYEAFRQLSIFDEKEKAESEAHVALPAKIFNWRRGRSIAFNACKGDEKVGKKLFDFIIGNPPYQEEFSTDGNRTYSAPIYNQFMDAADEIGRCVELVHPARFLFNAGSTPKSWNKKKLDDPHFKVLSYVEDASKLFPNTDIKGGVAITLRDETKNFGAIKVFTKYVELSSILKKVIAFDGFIGMETIVVSRTAYRLTDKMHEEHPEALSQLSKGHPYDMSTNIFDRLPQVFFDEKPKDGNEYIRILGRENNRRTYKYVKKSYVNTPAPLMKYSVALPKANNTGEFGETLAQPEITNPGTGTTETFLSVGYFSDEIEAASCLKYLSTKFARCLLGVLKTTQDLTPEKWKYVPLQDFTSSSDIDWSKNIPEIDRQLYAKYGLDADEIHFIETRVKEME